MSALQVINSIVCVCVYSLLISFFSVEMSNNKKLSLTVRLLYFSGIVIIGILSVSTVVALMIY